MDSRPVQGNDAEGSDQFNTYRFSDYKEKVIDLLRRVMRASVETLKIMEAMKAEKR